MALLRQHLAARQAHDLRNMASALGVSQRSHSKSAAWREAIAGFWENAGPASVLLAKISPQARHALCRLALLDSVPAPLFFAEYGGVRRPRQGAYAVPPWRQPQGAAEELYYFALLHDVDDTTINRANNLCLPADLRGIVFETICTETECHPSSDLLVDSDPWAAWALCHDVGQLLLLPAQEERTVHTLTLRHERWLDRTVLRRLDRRLIISEKPAPSSHRRSFRPRLLMLLALAAGLLRDGQISVSGRAWLAEPLPEQFLWLWRAWSTCSADLRHQFCLADGLLPAPWPQPILAALGEMTGPFSSLDLLAAVLSRSVDTPAYWPAQVDDLSSLETLLTSVLHDLSALFGLVAIQPTGPSATKELYQVTPTGGWLLDRPGAIAPEAPTPEIFASLTEAGDDRTMIECPATAPLAVQYGIGQFARYTETAGHNERTRHQYRFDRRSIGQAILNGCGLPSFQRILAELGLTLSPEQTQCLHEWQDSLHDVALTYRPMLRTNSRETMAALMQHESIYAQIDEIVGPTTALLQCTLPEVRQALQQQEIEPWVESKHEEGSTSLQSAAGLWLAGQLYRLLADHLPLPYSISQEMLNDLVAKGTSAEISLLQSKWSVLRSQALRLLDGETYTLPRFEVDEAVWQTLIAQAIDEDRLLSMCHFSVGRNLLVERTVQPYWIEDRRGYTYLRGECLQSERVLLFRLDRIQTLTLYSPT